MSAMLTVEDVADRYRLAPKTIRAYARDGRVQGAMKIGALWRFDADALDILPPARPEAPQTVIHPTAPASARRARPGSGRQALQNALQRPIAAPRRGKR